LEAGARYVGLNWDNFKCDHTGQTEVVQGLKHYARRLQSSVNKGEGVVLFGRPGTGKDLLLSILARLFGYNVAFQDGTRLWASLTEAILDDSSQVDILSRLATATVLYLADPVPGRKELTRFQREKLHHVLDERYRHHRPVWCSLNARDKSDAERLLGQNAWDRLKDGAVVCNCNWPSHRKPLRAWDGTKWVE